MSKVIDFLEKQGIEYKSATATELVVAVCPVNGCSKKCYVNKEKGLWDCKKCQAKGNFFKLKALYGVVEGVVSVRDMIGNTFKPLPDNMLVEHQAAFWKNQNAINYMYERGFTNDTLKFFKIGFMSDYQGDWIAIPYIQEGKLWNFKYRRFTGEKTFKRIQNCATTLFNIDAVDYSKNGILTVEGEMDAMAAWQMGVKNVVGMTAGAGTFKPEWLQFFTHFKTTYVCLDSDEKGQLGAKKIAEKIGLSKTKNVVLPTKDANEFMTTVSNSTTAFQNCIGGATRFEVSNVGTIRDIVNRLDDWFDGTDGGIRGLETGLPQLDKLTNGLKAGDLVVMTGDSGVGKTTITNNIINEMIQKDAPVFYFSLEGQIEYYITRMMGAELGLKYNQLRDDKALWEDIKQRMCELPLYYYNGPQGGLSLEQIRDIIQTVVNLYDVKCVVIDNLQRMVPGSSSMYYQQLAEAVSIVKDLAVDCKIPIILIAHITKIDDAKSVITMHDLKGTSSIYQTADIVLILQIIKKKYYLSLDKNRMGEGNLHIELTANKDIGKFSEHDDAIRTEQLDTPPIRVVD